MRWIEETPKRTRADTVDLAFRLSGGTLPVDHAAALGAAVAGVLPWFAAAEGTGLHPVHLAGSQNGWTRPGPETGEPLRLSRRTRLVLRLPRGRIDAARALCGITLDVDGHRIVPGEATIRPLTHAGTLFARHVCLPRADDEPAFIDEVLAALAAMDIDPPRLLPGRMATLASEHGTLHTRSLMVAGLAADEAVRLQCRGLGSGRHMGCGLFVEHKGIEPVAPAGED